MAYIIHMCTCMVEEIPKSNCTKPLLQPLRLSERENLYVIALQVSLQQATLPAPISHKPEGPSSTTQPSRPRSREAAETEPKPYQPPPRKDSKLLTAPLTAANYKDKFLLLNELEKEEHVRALERYTLLT